MLLRESPALPLVGLDEMLADLGLDDETTADDTPVLSRATALDLLEPTQRHVARVLAEGPTTIDGLCRSTALDPGVVTAALTLLQLRGWASVHGPTQLPAGPLARMDK